MRRPLPTRPTLPTLPTLTTVLAACAALALSGCASFSDDGAVGPASAMVQARTGHPVAAQRDAAGLEAARQRVDELLGAPLTADRAVELALLNHRGLQAALSELGVTEADRVRAGRLRNPLLSVSRLAEGGGVVEVERSLMMDLLGILSWPLADAAAQRELDAAQWRAAGTAVALAAQVRQAWVKAVAAGQLLGYQQQVQAAADAARELAERMRIAGNANALAALREQAFAAEAAAGLARARHAELAAREHLVRLLGLDASQHARLQLPARLPDLPALDASDTLPADAEQAALAERLDVQLARREAEARAKALGLARVTGSLPLLELGATRRTLTGEPAARGVEVELALPLFDFGVATRRARASYMQAVHRAAGIAVEAQSELREAWSAYRTAWALARRWQDEIVPLRRRISEENLLRYNGMLIGVFELLADAQEQISAVTASVQAQRDFWLAETDWQMARTGLSPAGGMQAGTATSAATSPAPQTGGGH